MNLTELSFNKGKILQGWALPILCVAKRGIKFESTGLPSIQKNNRHE